MENKEKNYFTVTGITMRLPDTEFIKPDMMVYLEKDPDNEYDKEAIKVYMAGIGQIGWVANSVHTVIGETYSAGRIYDKIGDAAEGKVLYNMSSAIICELV